MAMSRRDFMRRALGLVAAAALPLGVAFADRGREYEVLEFEGFEHRFEWDGGDGQGGPSLSQREATAYIEAMSDRGFFRQWDHDLARDMVRRGVEPTDG